MCVGSRSRTLGGIALGGTTDGARGLIFVGLKRRSSLRI
jgi:hypothetical protein